MCARRAVYDHSLGVVQLVISFPGGRRTIRASTSVGRAISVRRSDALLYRAGEQVRTSRQKTSLTASQEYQRKKNYQMTSSGRRVIPTSTRPATKIMSLRLPGPPSRRPAARPPNNSSPQRGATRIFTTMKRIYGTTRSSAN